MGSFDEYDKAIYERQNWAEEDGPGEVTYVGEYCVVTGIRNDGEDSPYGKSLPGTAPWVGIMYWVGSESLADAGFQSIGYYGSWDEVQAWHNHHRLVDQASRMDLLEFVYES